MAAPLSAFLNWLHIGDPDWAWRRRVIFTACLVQIVGILKVIFWPHDPAHDSLVMTACQGGLLGVLGIYVGLSTVDDHNKRETERKASQP
jgi:hypothetical protein